MTLLHIFNETLKLFSSLPILMQNYFLGQKSSVKFLCRSVMDLRPCITVMVDWVFNSLPSVMDHF